MRGSLWVLLLLCACDDSTPPIPAAEAPEPPAETAPTTEAPEAVIDTDQPAPENAAESDAEGEGDPEEETSPEEDANREASALNLHGALIAAPRPNARVELAGRINRAGILRLTRALGLPAPLHVHGRPLAVPESEQVISLVSFLSPGESDAGDERLTELTVDQMHSEVWLLESGGGSLFRVGAARIPYQPVPSYNDIAVGAENIGDALAIKAQNIEDFDVDGAMEYQLIVELIDEVAPGTGPVTHRYAMIFNLPAMTSALDIRTMTRGDGQFRSTFLWGDQNDDGHPDIDLRVRSCTEWSSETPDCVQETDTHVSYVWQQEEDRWD